MPNEWNKVIQGLTQAGQQLGLQGIDNSYKHEAGDKYAVYKSSLMDSYAKLMAQNQQLLTPNTPEGDQQQGQTSIAQNNQTEQIDPLKEYEKLVNFQSSMNGNPYGEQVSKQASDMYNMLLGKKEPVKRDIREGNDGLWYDLTSGKPEPIGGVKKEVKPPKKTVEDYGKFTYEDAVKLTPDELGDAYYFVPEDVQKKLYDSNKKIRDMVDSEFKEGIYAPKLSLKKGGRIGPGKLNITEGQGDDLKMFDNLDNINNTLRSGQELTDDVTKTYNTARLTLGKKYNLNDTQLAKVIDRLNGTETEKQKKEIIQSLSKGDYYEDVGTNQEQINYDRGRIKEWQTALNDAYNANDGSYDGYKQSFLKELQDFYYRGSLTKKEYDDLIKSYY